MSMYLNRGEETTMRIGRRSRTGLLLILIRTTSHRAAAFVSISYRYASSHPFHPKFETRVSIHPHYQSHSRTHNEDELKLEFQNLDQKGGWMHIDWNRRMTQQSNILEYANKSSSPSHTTTDNNSYSNDSLFHRPTLSPGRPSPVELVVVRDRIIYMKRDDLLRLRQSHVSGNKARKLLGLNELCLQEFPRAVVSFGGPQSNAMVAIAAIVNAKNREYIQQSYSPTRLDSMTTILDDDESVWIQDNLSELSLPVEEDWILDGTQTARDSTQHKNNKRSSSSVNGSRAVTSSYDSLLSSQEAAQILEEDEANLASQTDEEPFFSRQGTKEKRFRFIYYTKKLPRYLRKQPNGNLLRALSLGMELVELSPTAYGEMFSTDQGGSPSFSSKIKPPLPGQSLWIPQGGACSVAIPGARLLAQEIIDYWAVQGRGLPLSVCVPGGTCTTAMLLSREIESILNGGSKHDTSSKPLDIQVVVIPCVGDDLYAKRQMENLNMIIESPTDATYPISLPKILLPRKEKGKGKASSGYFVFGEPASPILETFLEMKEEYGVYLDLLYGSPAWTLLLQKWNSDLYNKQITNDDDCPLKGRQIMYVHSGGLEGISSQLTRYKHKGLVDSREIQPS